MRIGPILLATLCAGCSTTTFSSRVDGNPLEKIAAQAEASGRWSISERTETALHLRESWPVHSALALGYSAFHAELKYAAPKLWSTFYLQTNGVGTLGFSQTIDAEDGIYGGALKPRMRQAAREILDWGDVPESERPPLFQRE